MMIAQSLYLKEANENLQFKMCNEDVNLTKRQINIDDN